MLWKSTYKLERAVEQLTSDLIQIKKEVKRLSCLSNLEVRSKQMLTEEFSKRLDDLERDVSQLQADKEIRMTEEEYQKALKRIEVLMKDSEDAEDISELLELSIKAETYEQELFPVPEPSEDEKRKFREDQEGSLECSADLSAPS